VSLRVLVVEDDRASADEIAERLGEDGLEVEVAYDAPSGLRAAINGAFQVIVLDRLLPGFDGFSLMRRLRGEGVETPIIFLTALGAVADRVAGLEGGGDDYLVKPFSFAELKARVAVLGRRSAKPADGLTLTAGVLSIDRLERVARRDERDIELLPLEFKLLEVLALNAGRVVTRAMLLERVWGFHFDPRTNIVETHISRLRRKIDRPDEPSLIAHVRGAGYVLAA
jgi:two-component system, OmpR family, response regulator